jgi:hypothetical protein
MRSLHAWYLRVPFCAAAPSGASDGTLNLVEMLNSPVTTDSGLVENGYF